MNMSNNNGSQGNIYSRVNSKPSVRDGSVPGTDEGDRYNRLLERKLGPIERKLAENDTKHMSNNNDISAEVEFEYTGKGCVIPKNVTIVRFHPSVIEVEDNASVEGDRYNRLLERKLGPIERKLREVIFNDGLKKIGRRAFYECTSLSSIILPSTVTEIGYCAFNNCINLREVLLNEGLKRIGQSAFFGCRSLSSITLPSTVTEIGNGAFSSCINLREVVFRGVPRKIGKNEIGDRSFRNCSNLREVVLHGVPREIEKDAFYNCSSLERFTFPTIPTRLYNLIQTGHWSEIEYEVHEVRGVVEVSGGELFVSTQAMGGGNNWNAVRRDLDNIVRVISYYELKEATSMFELALWKFKLGQVEEDNPIPRKKCRMDVPGPVKDIILQYLPYECLLPVSDIPSSSSESDDEESIYGDY